MKNILGPLFLMSAICNVFENNAASESQQQIVIQGKAWKIYLFVCLLFFIIYVADFTSEGNRHDFLKVEFVSFKMVNNFGRQIILLFVTLRHNYTFYVLCQFFIGIFFWKLVFYFVMTKFTITWETFGGCQLQLIYNNHLCQMQITPRTIFTHIPCCIFLRVTHTYLSPKSVVISYLNLLNIIFGPPLRDIISMLYSWKFLIFHPSIKRNPIHWNRNDCKNIEEKNVHWHFSKDSFTM